MSRIYSQRNRDKQKRKLEELGIEKARLEDERTQLEEEAKELLENLAAAKAENSVLSKQAQGSDRLLASLLQSIQHHMEGRATNLPVAPILVRSQGVSVPSFVPPPAVTPPPNEANIQDYPPAASKKSLEGILKIMASANGMPIVQHQATASSYHRQCEASAGPMAVKPPPPPQPFPPTEAISSFNTITNVVSWPSLETVVRLLVLPQNMVTLVPSRHDGRSDSYQRTGGKAVSAREQPIE